jgi:magnesium transporter
MNNASSLNIGFIQEELLKGEFKNLKKMFNGIPPYDIAILLESSSPNNRAIIWQLIDEAIEGEILSNLSEEVREMILTFMDPSEVANVIKNLQPDQIADILQDLPETVIAEVLDAMTDQNRQLVKKVLVYPENTAGGLMNTDLILVRPNHTLEVVLKYLRLKKALPNSTDNLFVVSKTNKFRGVLPISKILTSSPDTLVKDLMQDEMDSINVDADSLEVIRVFEKNDLISAPVTDNENNLIGRITFDDVIDEIKSEADESLRQISGIDSDTFEKTSTAIKTRGFWLGTNLITALIAASVINIFKETLEEVIFLAVLMPIIASMGGVAATQTLTITVRGLALGQIVKANYKYIFNRELIVGITNGFLWAIVLSLIACLWFQDWTLIWVISLSMIINLLAGILSGMGIPILMRSLKMDPAVAGSVIVTTVTDVVGFFSFLGFASYFYS